MGGRRFGERGGLVKVPVGNDGALLGIVSLVSGGLGLAVPCRKIVSVSDSCFS